MLFPAVAQEHETELDHKFCRIAAFLDIPEQPREEEQLREEEQPREEARERVESDSALVLNPVMAHQQELERKATARALKKEAKAGRNESAKIMAKDLVRTRGYIKKMFKMKKKRMRMPLMTTHNKGLDFPLQSKHKMAGMRMMRRA